MALVERRSETRLRVLLNATVIVPGDPDGIRCCIRDASIKGCMFVSTYVHEFPDTIEFRVDGIERTLSGKVIWRSGKTAGVAFDWPECVAQDDDVADWLDLEADRSVEQPSADI